MSKQPIPCNESQLVFLIDGDEHSDAFRHSAAHLEYCESCQNRLTALAGDQHRWSEVADSLRDDTLRRESCATHHR